MTHKSIHTNIARIRNQHIESFGFYQDLFHSVWKVQNRGNTRETSGTVKHLCSTLRGRQTLPL